MATTEDVNEAIDSLERTVLKIKRDRDELLAIVKEMIPIAIGAIAFVDCKALVNRARIAVAMAEKGSE